MKTIDANKTSPKVYDPVWQCIYCGGNDGEPLTNEHIIPTGLQDGFILPKSSCVPCQRITGAVENTVRNFSPTNKPRLSDPQPVGAV